MRSDNKFRIWKIKDIVNERKTIEETLLKNMMKHKCYHKLKREPIYGRILSYSPYMAYEYTSLDVTNEVRGKYANLSRHIHNSKLLKRNNIEKEIRDILFLDEDVLLFEVINDILISYNNGYGYKFIINYYNREKKPSINKIKYNRLIKLCKKFKEESIKLHYSPTKQEKRYLKKHASK